MAQPKNLGKERKKEEKNTQCYCCTYIIFTIKVTLSHGIRRTNAIHTKHRHNNQELARMCMSWCKHFARFFFSYFKFCSTQSLFYREWIYVVVDFDEGEDIHRTASASELKCSEHGAEISKSTRFNAYWLSMLRFLWFCLCKWYRLLIAQNEARARTYSPKRFSHLFFFVKFWYTKYTLSFFCPFALPCINMLTVSFGYWVSFLSPFSPCCCRCRHFLCMLDMRKNRVTNG